MLIKLIRKKELEAAGTGTNYNEDMKTEDQMRPG